MADDQPNLMEMVTALIEGLRADFTKSCEQMSAKYDALSEAIAKKSNDGGDMAEQVAADEAGSRSVKNEEMLQAKRDSASDIRVANSLLTGLARDMSALKKQVSRPMGGDLNAFADAQAKADSVMRALGTRAEPNMPGEDLIAYQIRLARKMQPHSKRWKGVDLSIIAADRVALDNVLSEIRSDALADSMNFDNAPEFAHRMVTKTSPGGHTINEFYGRGTFIKQMSRPVRYVQRIGPRWEGAGA